MEANGLTAYPPDEYWEANESRGWEAAAQAAIDAFLDGDSVSAESIREALAAHEQPQPPKLAANPQDLAEQWLGAAYEPDDSQTDISYDRDDMNRGESA